MSRKHSLCFIDDDPAEIARFKRAVGGEFFLGAGTSLDAALKDLRAQGKKHADLFVLDMYFPSAGANTAAELSKLGKAWDDFRAAEAALKNVLADLGQSTAGGRALASQISSRRFFGRTPFVFFTRKGNLLDAIEAYEQIGALGVIKKPDPRGSVSEPERIKAYDDAIVENRDTLIRALESSNSSRKLVVPIQGAVSRILGRGSKFRGGLVLY